MQRIHRQAIADPDDRSGIPAGIATGRAWWVALGPAKVGPDLRDSDRLPCPIPERERSALAGRDAREAVAHVARMAGWIPQPWPSGLVGGQALEGTGSAAGPGARAALTEVRLGDRPWRPDASPQDGGGRGIGLALPLPVPEQRAHGSVGQGLEAHLPEILARDPLRLPRVGCRRQGAGRGPVLLSHLVMISEPGTFSPGRERAEGAKRGPVCMSCPATSGCGGAAGA